MLPDNQDDFSSTAIQGMNFIEASFKLTMNITCNNVINEFRNTSKVPSSFNIRILILLIH